MAGTGAGAAGLAVGGITGAALGIVPAVFTFGLSIPVGCALGNKLPLAVQLCPVLSSPRESEHIPKGRRETSIHQRCFQL